MKLDKLHVIALDASAYHCQEAATVKRVGSSASREVRSISDGS
jgi:hypothetical protein